MVVDAGRALRAPGAGQGVGAADESHTRHRSGPRRRVRRQDGPFRARDHRREAGHDHGPAREMHADARGSLLRTARPAPGSDVGADGRDQRRPDHGHAFQERARRRGLWLIRRRVHFLYGRSPDGHLRHPGLSIRRLPGLHEQAAVRAEARPRHPPTTIRDRAAPREDRPRARHRPGRDEAPQLRASRNAPIA